MIKIRAIGDWGPEQLRVRNAPDSRIRLPEVDHLIEQSWANALAQRGKKLFDGPMCRLETWNASAGFLELTLSHTSYKVFFGTNLSHPGLADRFGEQVLANPVGLSAALLTADGFLMLGVRNNSVAYYPNRIHPFAGSLEPADERDLFAAVRRELSEELGLKSDDLADMRCSGIVEDAALRHPEIIFRVRSRLTQSEIKANLDTGEHLASWSVANKPDAIETALRHSDLTPVGMASLLLWGNAVFGADWMNLLPTDFIISTVV